MILVPKLDDFHLKKIIKKINSSSQPIFISVKSEDYAQENECVGNVREKIKKDGGSQILGWQIWKSDFLIEAEFHSVWQSPSNKLIDITQKLIPITPDFLIPASEILFIPDQKIKYTEVQIDNIRLNITDNPVVDDIISLFEARFKLLNKGIRAFEYAVQLNNKETELLNKIKELQIKLYSLIKTGIDRKTLCFCNSFKKYEDCCYKDVIKVLEY